MKTYLSILLLLISVHLSAQSVLGKWTTIDSDGVEKSIVEIYEQDKKIYGKIIDVLDANKKDALCEKCKGDDLNKPIIGLNIIKNLTFDGDYYRNGTIFDPEKGKSYKCRLSIDSDNPDVLEVRGYIAFMYETQHWKRVK